MKRCVIFGAAPIEDYSFITLGEQDVICADGGIIHAQKMGLHVDVLVGDFDSLPDDVDIVADEVLTFPKKKDDTDLILAVKSGIQRGCNDFTLYGVTGRRLDHTLAAISALSFLNEAGCNAKIVDTLNEVMVLSEGLHIIDRPKEAYVSLFVLGCSDAYVNLKGFAYPGDITLSSSFPLGVSNEILQKTGEIRVISGPILMIISKKQEHK